MNRVAGLSHRPLVFRHLFCFNAGGDPTARSAGHRADRECRRQPAETARHDVGAGGVVPAPARRRRHGAPDRHPRAAGLLRRRGRLHHGDRGRDRLPGALGHRGARSRHAGELQYLQGLRRPRLRLRAADECGHPARDRRRWRALLRRRQRLRRDGDRPRHRQRLHPPRRDPTRLGGLRRVRLAHRADRRAPRHRLLEPAASVAHAGRRRRRGAARAYGERRSAAASAPASW